VLAYWRDVASDFSVFHRLRNLERGGEVDAPEFFALAHRLDLYGGAVALRVAQQREKPRGAQAGVAGEPMDFDDYFAGRQVQLIEAAARMEGGD
jgi:hypothetical protein